MANDRRRPGARATHPGTPATPRVQNYSHRPGKPYGPGRTSRTRPRPKDRSTLHPIGTGVPGPPAQGVLELHPKGFGFLRNPKTITPPSPADPYVPAPLIEKSACARGCCSPARPRPPARRRPAAHRRRDDRGPGPRPVPAPQLRRADRRSTRPSRSSWKPARSR